MTKDEIQEICKKFLITNYSFNSDGSIDVLSDVYLRNSELIDIPLKFRKVYGDFICNGNLLTSLEGSPIYCSGSFDCSDNNLSNLIGAPSYVGKDFSCKRCNLTSLEGSPNKVLGSYICADNKLTSLEFGPGSVGGFTCRSNRLTNLIGSPSEVENIFNFTNNPVETLDGCPLNIKQHHLYLNSKFKYSDYLEYNNRTIRDLKFKKILKNI